MHRTMQQTLLIFPYKKSFSPQTFEVFSEIWMRKKVLKPQLDPNHVFFLLLNKELWTLTHTET